MLEVSVCGYGAVHLGACHVLLDVDPGVAELSVVIAYTSCALGGPGNHRKGHGGDLGVKLVVSERSRIAATWT